MTLRLQEEKYEAKSRTKNPKLTIKTLRLSESKRSIREKHEICKRNGYDTQTPGRKRPRHSDKRNRKEQEVKTEPKRTRNHKKPKTRHHEQPTNNDYTHSKKKKSMENDNKKKKLKGQENKTLAE